MKEAINVKTKKSVVALLAGILILAAGGLYAEFNSGYYSPETTGLIRQTLGRAGSTDARFEVASYGLYQPALEPGEGRQEVEAYCNTCHSPRYIPMQPPLPAATWEAEVNKMIKTFGASIPDDSTQKITRYLQSHYTPNTRKR